MSSIDATLAERGSRYGEFPEHASITQGLKLVMLRGRQWDALADDMKEALEMVAHKIGRILNGDPNYIDSWTDIIGYTRLVEKRLIGAEQASAKALMDNVVPIGTKSDRNKFPETVAEANSKIMRAAEAAVARTAEAACDCPGCQIERALNKVFKPAA